VEFLSLIVMVELKPILLVEVKEPIGVTKDNLR
jgi:hypothetical protein